MASDSEDDDLQATMSRWRHTVAKAQATITLSATTTMALVVRSIQQSEAERCGKHCTALAVSRQETGMGGHVCEAGESAVTSQADSDDKIDTGMIDGAQHDDAGNQKGCDANDASTPLCTEKCHVYTCNAGKGDQATQGAGAKESTAEH